MALKRYTNANRFIDDEDDLDYAQEVAKLQDENGGVDPDDVESAPSTPVNSDDTKEDETWKQRYGNLRRYSQQQTDELKELKQEVARLRKGTVKPPKTDEEFKEWAEKYPESVAYIKTLVMKEIEGMEDVKAVSATAERLNELEQRLATERAYNELLRRHPDFEDIKKDQKFKDWIQARHDRNPKDWVIQALYQGLDVDAADEAITLYKDQNNVKSPKKKNAEKEAAASIDVNDEPTAPNGSQKRKWKESEIEKLSTKDFEKYEDEIMEAMTKGEIEMDLSGGAR